MINAFYSDKTIVIDILCQAFDRNKSVNYIVKQDNRREERIRKLMEYSFEICFMFGRVYLSDDRNSCALMLLPEQKKTSFKSITLDMKMVISCIGVGRIFKILNRQSKIKKAYPKHPIFYLWFIGVYSDKKRKGIGSTLLKEIIKESDLIKKPIYLETSKPENVSFYKKFGFNVYKELDFDHKLFLINRQQ